MLVLAGAVATYVPGCRTIRFDPVVHLHRRHRAGVIDDSECDAAMAAIRSRNWPKTFAHGDLTPRNVIASNGQLVLIDWEFAGWHPEAYDAAHLWVVSIEVPGARSTIEQWVAPSQRASFWLSAYLIYLLHIQLYRHRPDAAGFLPTHYGWKDHALRSLLGIGATDQ